MTWSWEEFCTSRRTINNHTGKEMTASRERCFQQNILNAVFMDSSCYGDIYRLDANVEHMVCSSRNTLSIKLCTVLSHAALSSEDFLKNICGKCFCNFQKVGWTTRRALSLWRSSFPYDCHCSDPVSRASQGHPALTCKAKISLLFCFLTCINHCGDVVGNTKYRYMNNWKAGSLCL